MKEIVMTEQRQQSQPGGGDAAPGEADRQDRPQPASGDAAHAGDKPADAGADGGKHPVDQKVQEESGKDRAGNRGYD
jgi:hypothetical protein